MHLVEQAKSVMVRFGAEWVLWLLLALSVVSFALIVERALVLRALRVDIDLLRATLRDALRAGGFPQARVVMASFPHPAVQVVMRGMDGCEAETTPEQSEKAMDAEVIAQRQLLDRRFTLLATLGANAPFIGLFGTVIGILQAFEGLGKASTATQVASAIAPQAVMSSIAEALVATAVGLGVAIPAVFAFNLFQRALERTFEQAHMLALEVSSYLHTGGPRSSQSIHPELQTKSGSPPRPARSSVV